MNLPLSRSSSCSSLALNPRLTNNTNSTIAAVAVAAAAAAAAAASGGSAHNSLSLDVPAYHAAEPVLANLKSHEVEDMRQFTCSLLDAYYTTAFFLKFIYSQGHICLCLRMPGPKGKLVGSISGRLEKIQNSDCNIFSAHIYTLAVDNECRRMGLGSQLIRDFVDRMTVLARRQKGQLTQVTLETKSGDHAAQTFYRKLGFFPVENIKDYYGSAGDGLILIKSL